MYKKITGVALKLGESKVQRLFKQSQKEYKQAVCFLLLEMNEIKIKPNILFGL